MSYTLEPLAEYRYDEQGRIDTVSYANDVDMINQYNAKVGFLTRRDYQDNGSNLFYVINQYDSVGNIIQQQVKHGSSNPDTSTFTYDKLLKL